MAMNRRHLIVTLGLIVAAVVIGSRVTRAGLFGPKPWSKRPAVTIVSAAGDPRIPVVREAVDFWNRTFAELGTPFRLGEVTLVTGSVPGADLQALSEQVRGGTWWPALPASVQGFPGDLLVVLSEANFISCSARQGQRGMIAIKNGELPPLTMPNVLRNVIAHELGHVIGLRHDADPALLMCGRPAPCRPDAFRSETPRFFPLSADEKAHLRALYPADWAAR